MKDKIVVIDTNVLLHDPEAPHRFGDLRVVIPMQVVEEIDRFKKDHSEKASIQANLISDSTEKLYTYNYVVPYSYFMKIETGYNYNTDKGLNVYTKFGRIQKSNDDFENIITIEFSQSF